MKKICKNCKHFNVCNNMMEFDMCLPEMDGFEEIDPTKRFIYISVRDYDNVPIEDFIFETNAPKQLRCTQDSCFQGFCTFYFWRNNVQKWPGSAVLAPEAPK